MSSKIPVQVAYTLPELLLSFDHCLNFSHAMSGQLYKENKVKIESKDIMNAMVTVLGFDSKEDLENRFKQLHEAINEAINENQKVQDKHNSVMAKISKESQERKLSDDDFERHIQENEYHYASNAALALFGHNVEESKISIFTIYKGSKEDAIKKLISNAETYINEVDCDLSQYLLENLSSRITKEFKIVNADNNDCTILVNINRNLAVYMAIIALEEQLQFSLKHDPENISSPLDIFKRLNQSIYSAYVHFLGIMTKKRLAGLNIKDLN
jgi:Trp operon repressor